MEIMHEHEKNTIYKISILDEKWSLKPCSFGMTPKHIPESVKGFSELPDPNSGPCESPWPFWNGW